jgi:hypothetical protein
MTPRLFGYPFGLDLIGGYAALDDIPYRNGASLAEKRPQKRGKPRSYVIRMLLNERHFRF